MCFVMALEQHRGFEDRLLQQTALRAQLVGVDRLVLQAKCDVQDARILVRIATGSLGHALTAGEQRDGGGG